MRHVQKYQQDINISDGKIWMTYTTKVTTLFKLRKIFLVLQKEFTYSKINLLAPEFYI